MYCLGGYGYSATRGDHTTYPYLTAIKIPDVIDASINIKSIVDYFWQITNTKFQITGGYLVKIYDVFYLVGGHKFLGRYNSHGPNHGPGFVQEGKIAKRKFIIQDDGNSIVINHLSKIVDEVNLHLREFNVVPQIMPNGQEGATDFSRVFKQGVNLPFLNCVNIDSNGYTVNNDFKQYYNHYHCAHVPLYSAGSNEMHTIFSEVLPKILTTIAYLSKMPMCCL